MNFNKLDGLKNGARTVFLWCWIPTILALAFFAMAATGGASAAMGALIVTVPFVIASIWAYTGIKRERTHNSNVLAQFAADNAWKFTAQNDVAAYDVGTGTLFGHGHTKVIRYVLEGTVSSLPASLFGYDYVTGSGKHRRDHHVTVMRLELPRVLPHMIIDSTVEDGDNGSSVLPVGFDASQRIQLEGEFSNYFSCYAPSGYAISLLTVIAPDAMLMLMRQGAACDIEIIDNHLYFYWPAKASTRKGYEHIFATSEAVMKEVGHKLAKSDIYATREQASLHSTENAQGVRLAKPAMSALAVLVTAICIIAFIGGFMWLQYEHPAGVAVVVIAVVVGSFVLAIGSMHEKKQKREALRRRFGAQ
jgi:hypothetical protein